MIQKARLMIDRRYRWLILALLGDDPAGICRGMACEGAAPPYCLHTGADASRDMGYRWGYPGVVHW